MGSQSCFLKRSEASYKRLESQQSEERQWVVHIKSCLGDAKFRESMHPPSIFMASSPLRGLKHEDFVPQVVAIGPYHSELGPHHSSFPDNQETERYKAIAAKEMEKHKLMACIYIEKNLKGRSFCSLADEFLQMIKQIRDEYDTELESCQVDEKLAYMLALDAAFVVEFLRFNAGMKCGFNDYINPKFPTPLRKSILQDFLLLENQLPLFLLLKVMSLEESCATAAHAAEELGVLIKKVACEVLPFSALSEDRVRSIADRVSERKHLLDCLYGVVTYGSGCMSSSSDTTFPTDTLVEKPTHRVSERKHLLDCLYGVVTYGRGCMSSSSNTTFPTDTLVEKPTHFPRAVELYNSGITFKGIELSNMISVKSNMISVKFNPKKAILYVPKIRVGDDTERLFRNLLAYESHLIDEVHVLSYLRFMNNLVDGPDDVALLVEKGVLAQDIGSNEEVADMWNRLCINTMRVCSAENEDVAKQLLQHCQYRLNALKAEFKREYLSHPWLVLSVLSGASLLIMTLLITLYTIKLYYKPGG